MYVPGTVSDISCRDFHFGNVASLLSAAAGSFKHLTYCKCAAKWVIWDERTLKHSLKGHKFLKTQGENSKRRVELALVFYFIKSNGLYTDGFTCRRSAMSKRTAGQNALVCREEHGWSTAKL